MGRGGRDKGIGLAEAPRRQAPARREVLVGASHHQLDLENIGAPANYRALLACAEQQPRRRFGFFSGLKPIRLSVAGKRVKLRLVALEAGWEELAIDVWRDGSPHSYPGARGFAELAGEDPQLVRELLESVFG